MENWGAYLTIIFSSGIKFIAGPVLGYSLKLSLLETILSTWLGMMLSVSVFVGLGKLLRQLYFTYFKKEKGNNFNKRTRLAIQVWQKFGVIGISILTPLIFTPIGGSLLCMSFKVPYLRILFFMALSGLIWASILSGLIFSLDSVRNFII